MIVPGSGLGLRTVSFRWGSETKTLVLVGLLDFVLSLVSLVSLASLNLLVWVPA